MARETRPPTPLLPTQRLPGNTGPWPGRLGRLSRCCPHRGCREIQVRGPGDSAAYPAGAHTEAAWKYRSVARETRPPTPLLPTVEAAGKCRSVARETRPPTPLVPMERLPGNTGPWPGRLGLLSHCCPRRGCREIPWPRRLGRLFRCCPRRGCREIQVCGPGDSVAYPAAAHAEVAGKYRSLARETQPPTPLLPTQRLPGNTGPWPGRLGRLPRCCPRRGCREIQVRGPGDWAAYSAAAHAEAAGKYRSVARETQPPTPLLPTQRLPGNTGAGRWERH
nr:uncharacterized protein LOC117974479 [Pan paniscus]